MNRRMTRRRVVAGLVVLTLVGGGTATLSFGGVSATSPLNVVTGSSGTTATQVLNHLITIPALAGNEVQSLTLLADGGSPVPCRTPALAGNPAAAALVTALGGSLPEG